MSLPDATTEFVTDPIPAEKGRSGRTGWTVRDTIAAVVWAVGVAVFTVSVNTTWYVLDGQAFDVARNATAMRPLIGAGVIGSSTFAYYLFAVILLSGLAAAAIHDRRHRTAWQAATVAAAVTIEVVLVQMAAGGPVLGRQHLGDVTPRSVTGGVWLAIASVALIAVAALVPGIRVPAVRPTRRQIAGIVALIAAIGAYGIAYAQTWLVSTGGVRFHVGSSPVGSAYLILGLILISAAAAACVTDSDVIRIAVTTIGGVWVMAIHLPLLLTPLAFVFRPGPAADVLFMRAGIASAPLFTGSGGFGAIAGLVAIVLTVAAAILVTGPPPRAVAPERVWLVTVATFMGAIVAPWVVLTTVGISARMSPLTGVAAFAGATSVAQLVALPILVGTSYLTAHRGIVRRPVTALAAALIAIDIAIALVPRRFVALTLAITPIHARLAPGILLPVATAAAAIAAAWWHRPPRPVGVAQAALVGAAAVAGAVALGTSWAVGDVESVGHFVATIYSAPQGLAIVLAALLLVTAVAVRRPAANVFTIGAGIAFLAVVGQLIARPAWLLPDQYAATLVQYDNHEHVTIGIGLYAFTALIVGAVVTAIVATVRADR
jgi:hypothetical protein